MSAKLSAPQRSAVSRISGLVIVNAMIFQEILAEYDPRVLPLKKVLARENILQELCDHWDYIVQDIDYYPIFYLAREIVLNLTASQDVVRGIIRLAETAQGIVHMRAALRHDLMGRIYHRLLVEAKYLGTYYTGIPAAALLLKLALRPTAWEVNWHSLEALRQFRVADLACGTGTLLMAAADAITDNYLSSAAERGEKIDVSSLQNVLAEDILYGYDVLPSAIHLTASTLALRAPHIAFTKMNLFSLPLGGQAHRLGSLEFLKGRYTQMVMDLSGALPKLQQVKGKAIQDIPSAPLPDLDLCVMNPPFTRSVGGNLLFGSVPEKERAQMQKDLKALVKKPGIQANITAGLGSVFVAAAHPYIKPGGRIALVLPKAVLSGIAWKPTRDLLSKDYRVEYIVASQDPERWNFSESTDLSEVLLVARKQGAEQGEEPPRVVGVNLWRNPGTSFEAFAIAHCLAKGDPPDLVTGQGAYEVCIGNRKVGEAISIPWEDLQAQPSWLLPCAFAQSDLIRAAYHLQRGDIWLPGRGIVGHIPLCPLGNLGTLGPDARDIHDGFTISQTATPYLAFWGHDAKSMAALSQQPNCFLQPLPKAKAGRHLRRAEDLWPLAARVLVAERLRLNTQALAAVRLSRPVVSSVWWTVNIGDEHEDMEKAITLWWNSTLGLLQLLARREETQGAWVKFKKPTLSVMPVLDLRALAPEQLNALAVVYDAVCERALLPLPQMDTDPVRAEIDQAIAQVLALPDFSVLRTMLAREPGVCLRSLV